MYIVCVLQLACLESVSVQKSYDIYRPVLCVLLAGRTEARVTPPAYSTVSLRLVFYRYFVHCIGIVGKFWTICTL